VKEVTLLEEQVRFLRGQYFFGLLSMKQRESAHPQERD